VKQTGQGAQHGTGVTAHVDTKPSGLRYSHVTLCASCLGASTSPLLLTISHCHARNYSSVA
jgi:hypothetical protein